MKFDIQKSPGKRSGLKLVAGCIFFMTVHSGGGVKATACAVMENVKSFTGDVPPSDDIASLALQYLLKTK